MFVRPETIDRLTREQPSNKTFFSPRTMFASQTIWRLPYSFLLLFLSPVRFPSTNRAECESRIHRRAPRKWRIILPSQLISPNTISRMQRERHLRLNLPLNANGLSSPRSKYNTWIHRVEIIIFIVRLFQKFMLRHKRCYMTCHRCYQLSYDYRPFFTISRVLLCSVIVFYWAIFMRELSMKDYSLLCASRCLLSSWNRGTRHENGDTPSLSSHLDDTSDIPIA